MNRFFLTLFSYIKLYKWILLIVVFGIIFFLFIVLIAFQPRQTIPAPSQTTSTPTPFPQEQNPGLKLEEDDPHHQPEEPLENDSSFLRKFQRQDGLTEYSFTSPNPIRPQLVVMDPNNIPVFQRTVFPANDNITTSVYQSDTGEADRVVKGSSFYGPDALLYIYSSQGFSFIAGKNNKVFEQHIFSPMSVDEYLQKFQVFL